jgi:hypothetical protein
MRTTFSIPEVMEVPISKTCVTKQIKDWIDSNSYLQQHGLIWQMGITDCENLCHLERQIRGDLNCKHWKNWRMDSFKEAMEVIRGLNKIPLVFKSPHNNYSNKGFCIFIYKTSIPKNSQLFYSLRS